MQQVIVWDNDGTRTTEQCASTAEALQRAKAVRTLANRTVKIADAFGSTHHWSRTQHLKRNHWCARAVASEGFL